MNLPSEHASPGFWTRLRGHGDAIALIDPEDTWTYERLARACEDVADALSGPRKLLVFVFGANTAETIAVYLGALLARQALHLSTGPINAESARAAIRAFLPDVVAWFDGTLPDSLRTEYREERPLGPCRLAWLRSPAIGPPPASDLAILLSTSGTTGSPRMVRLSTTNVAVAAQQVVRALSINQAERALLAVPIAHIYGMSIVHSHLAAGASVILDRRSPAARQLWRRASQLNVTTIPGVSMTFEYMQHLNVDRSMYPRLRKVTHTGDPARRTLVDWIEHLLMPAGCELFLMYGQTEATGRISVLPPADLRQRPESVGIPVPYGSISISEPGEIIFRGPNVMLGYATRREELAAPDACHGVLHTGDAGRLDREGFLYVTGRISRFCKVFGRRIDLGEVEACLRVQGLGGVAAIEANGTLVVFYEDISASAEEIIREHVAAWHLPPQHVRLRALSSIPRGHSGKISYSKLARLV